MDKLEKDMIFQRLLELENEVRKLKRIADFNDKNVPLKYRKAFPNQDEDPFFTAPKFYPQTPFAFRLNKSGIEPALTELAIPTDLSECAKAKERLRFYLENKRSVKKTHVCDAKSTLTQEERHRKEHPEAFMPKTSEDSSSEQEKLQPDP